MKTLRQTNQLALALVVFIAGFTLGALLQERKDFHDAVEPLLVQQGKYERLLDSTVNYVYSKYDDYLPDSYWENDIYFDLYEDSECWDR